MYGHGDAYRLGGDEFCVVLHPGAAAAWSRSPCACVAALSEQGEGFEITTSHGSVMAPVEVISPTAALQLADRRMYARKGGRRMSAGRQSRDVLLSTLSERQPDLHAHLRDTADLAHAVGRELDMDAEELDGWGVRRSCTTSARSRSPTRSWRSPARSTRPSGASCGATR